MTARRSLAMLLLALATGGCGYVEPEAAVPAPAALGGGGGGAIAAARPGSLAGVLRGPAAGLIANNAASLIGNHAAGVISNNAGGLVSNNSAGVVQGNTSNYALRQAGGAGLSSPVGGVAVALYDAQGQRLAAEATTDAEGRFRFEGVSAPGRVLFVRGRYQQEGHAVELAATVATPVAGEALEVAVDPATTLVAKKMTALLDARQVAAGALDAAALEGLARDLAGLLDARDVVAAAILPAARVAETFDRLAGEHEAVGLTLHKALEEPAPAAAAGEAPQGPVATGRVSTLAGGGAGFADGEASAARFAYPQGLALDAEGGLFVADYNNHRIRRVAPDGRVTTVAGDGTPGFADGEAGTARFRHPRGLAWHQGALYVVDAGNRAVRVLRAEAGGWKVGTVAGGPDVAPEAGFVAPRDLAVDPAAGAPTLYVADTGGFRVRRVVVGQGVTTACELAGDANGQLAGPQGVAVDPAGALYVADATTNAIRRFPQAAGPALGPSATFAGGGFVGLLDGQGLQARFAYPAAIAFGQAGTLFVADQLNHAVRRVAASGGVSTVAGAGEAGEADGVGAAARFFRPSGLAVAADGTLFVADTDNHRIRRIRP